MFRFVRARPLDFMKSISNNDVLDPRVNYIYRLFEGLECKMQNKGDSIGNRRVHSEGKLSYSAESRMGKNHLIDTTLKRKLERLMNVKPNRYSKGKKFDGRSKPKTMNASSVARMKRSMSTSLDALWSNKTNDPKNEPNEGEAEGAMVELNRNFGVHLESTDISDRFRPPNIVTLNVSGLRFQTYLETLEKLPHTLLGHCVKRQRYYNPHTKEYFFDRNRDSFGGILHCYQDGRVHRPSGVPIAIFMRELKFFEMGDDILEQFWASEGYQKPDEVLMPDNVQQKWLWQLFEYPDSSVSARIMAFVSVFIIVVSIVSFCLETTELGASRLMKKSPKFDWDNPFFWIELVCIVWFTVELTLRFVASPSKTRFCSHFLNIIDFLAIAPFFVTFFLVDTGGSTMSFAVLRVLRLVRVFRILKLSRHSVGLQILGKTFRASVQEFCLLIFFLTIAIVLFSSGVYFAEQGQKDTKFTSIPASFWFALVTMTTVGYGNIGDMVPTSFYGKIVGAMCTLIGVLTLALPVPIIVGNFKHFYRQETRLASMRTPEDNEEDRHFEPV